MNEDWLKFCDKVILAFGVFFTGLGGLLKIMSVRRDRKARKTKEKK